MDYDLTSTPIRLFDYPVKDNGIFDQPAFGNPHSRLADNKDLASAVFTFEAIENSKDALKEEFGDMWRGVSYALARTQSKLLESIITESRFKAGTFRHVDGTKSKLSSKDTSVLNSMLDETTDKSTMWNLALSSKNELKDMLEFAKAQQNG